MTYLDTLKLEAEKTIRPQAVHLAKLVKNLAGIRHRAAAEDEKVVRLVEDVARLEAAAAEALGGSTNDCERFKTSIKKLTVRLATSREVVELFKKIIPPAQREIDEAREKLAQTFTTLCGESRAGCEASMAEKLAGVVAEHDAFLSAIAELGKTYGTATRAPPPVAYSPRIVEVAHRISGGRWLTFSAAPAATKPAAAVLAQAAPAESTRTPGQAPGVEEVRPLPPEATTEPPGVAAERPTEAAAPLGARARVLRRGAVATETPIEPAAPAEVDADDQGESDADLDDLDGPEAPPIAGEENPPEAAATVDLDAGEEADEAEAEAEAGAPGSAPTPGE